MPIPWTLQKYIFREMGKSFGLTAVSLTGVLGLGGGVLQMIDLGEITPSQLLRLMLLMLPVAAALTLPIAALFSAASVYGRLSADNEFVACRSSGINLYVLFIPAIMLSLVSALVTFVFSSFVIPGLVHNIQAFIAGDVTAWIKHRLDTPRGVTLGGRYRIYADDYEADPATPGQIVLRGVAWVEVDDTEWVRYGTAGEVRLAYFENPDADIDARYSVTATMIDISSYDREDKQFYEQAEQTIASRSVPQQFPVKLKFLTLGELFHYYRNPMAWREVRSDIQRLRVAVGRHLMFEALSTEWLRDKAIVLADDETSVTVSADVAMLVPGDGGIEFSQNVDITENRLDRTLSVQAQRAVLDMARGQSDGGFGMEIDAYEVEIFDRGDSVKRRRETLGPYPAPAEVVARVEAMDDATLLEVASGIEEVHERFRTASEAAGNTTRRIVGTIHERLAFSISVVVLVILGAALGIVFRGAHVMVAFGISFVPSLLIIVAIVMGKQMTYNAPTYGTGLAVLWSGIVIVAMLDAWTLARVLRR